MHDTTEVHIPEQPIPSSRRCHHHEPEGRRCGSPAMRGENFCYHHHQTRRPIANLRLRRARQSNFSLPEPSSRAEIQQAIGTIMLRIANNDIDLRRAGLLLYALQIANSNLTAFQHQNTATQPNSQPTAASVAMLTQPEDLEPTEAAPLRRSSHQQKCHPERNDETRKASPERANGESNGKDLGSDTSPEPDSIPAHYGSGPTPDFDHPSTGQPENRVDFTPPPAVWRRLSKPIGAALLDTLARSTGAEPLSGSPDDRMPEKKDFPSDAAEPLRGG
ncbi:hypothetical protein [Edaphobacter albus]|uniref:hypothetical protein n=1 Tax=Edaphobacter sp. 4G125 TaxID=2763071 RepID=UPI001645A902|nr:hypothetical protein [Edaphobacter sp. 4G125]QNI35960.1 hypothetical protein H7846_13195 [Edaphobacter sp. 4G125]